jgi:hypothetical protein
MDEKLAEQALRYYEHALTEVLFDIGETFSSTSDVINEFYKKHSPARESDIQTHNIFLHLSIQKFIEDALVDNVSDSFSPPFIKTSQKLVKNGFKNEVSAKCEKLEDAQIEWLTSAFNSIARRFDKVELLEYYKKRSDEFSSRSIANSEDAKTSSDVDNNYSDRWEPIKIDRAAIEFSQAIEASEAALREIESSNGYASSAPEERNAIVASIKGTLEATKEGNPSKSAVIAGLIRPLEYIAKKFSDVTMGEIAKIAVAKLWALMTMWMS